jgi:methylated-DNA-[protein]-cysteine S-methyltransferase
MDSPLGPLDLTASETGLTSVSWAMPHLPLRNQAHDFAHAPAEKGGSSFILARAKSQLDDYFNGSRKDFDLPFDLEGTGFQKKVWSELRRIPYGKTVTYSELARLIGHAGAARAVGTANGKNPLCVIIPCHRVLPAIGGVGGYVGGSKIKSELLTIERGT